MEHPKPKYEVGDIVEHKIIRGKFVVIKRYADDFNRAASTSPNSDYALRNESGDTIEDIFEQELK